MMQFLDLTLPTMAENLALDEALLEMTDALPGGGETLRVWQATCPSVVLGRSSRYGDEVKLEEATRRAIPIFRRVSGGATVVVGPGCMFYALILSLERQPQLRMLDQAHRFVMGRMQTALGALLPNVVFEGTCDLVVDNKKISGNSVRVARNSMLYHGTLLLNMDLSLVDHLLNHPPREPDYRQGRRHSDFIDNCHLPYASVVEALRLTWQATVSTHSIPVSVVDQLVRAKYSQPSWNLQR